MIPQESVELPDYSLVSWRRAGDSDFTGGLVHLGLVWSLADVPEIEGDVIRAWSSRAGLRDRTAG